MGVETGDGEGEVGGGAAVDGTDVKGPKRGESGITVAGGEVSSVLVSFEDPEPGGTFAGVKT